MKARPGAGRNAGQPVSPNPPSHEGLLTPARRASARMRAECGRRACGVRAGGGRGAAVWGLAFRFRVKAAFQPCAALTQA